MTSLISWAGIDSRRPQSLYIASDSRITWSARGAAPGTWDFGRKVFASRTMPEVFGYSGDVMLPSMLLGQVCDLADAGTLFPRGCSPEMKAEAVFDFLARGVAAYPDDYRNEFTIVYGTREGERLFHGEPYEFRLWLYSWRRTSGWTKKWQSLPGKSEVIVIEGSGTASVSRCANAWTKSSSGRTSRAVFSAFCDSLSSGDDPCSGGAPQLVRLHPRGPAAVVGIIWKHERYLLGQKIDMPTSGALEWRNELFERCDPHTLKRLAGAQPQPRPRDL